MKKFTSVLLGLALLTTSVLAFDISGTVSSLKQRHGGTIEVTLLRADTSLVTKVIVGTDSMKKEKLALLMMARSLDANVTIELVSGGIIEGVQVD